jgi:hypothetical protein
VQRVPNSAAVRAELRGVRARIGALAALLVLGLSVPAGAAADPTPDQAVANLNAWRNEVGESLVSTTTVAAWNTGCLHHNNYEVQHGNTLTHQEQQNTAGYTDDGAEAGSNSVIADFVSYPNATPVASLLPGPTWDGAVFHRQALLDPRLGKIGFDSTTVPESGGQWWSFGCLYVQSGDATNGQALDDTRTTPGLTLYPSPGNGAYRVPTSFPGNESPDPNQETGVNGAHLGWLLSVEINGPWAATNYGYGAVAHDVTATLTPDGGGTPVSVVISECGANGCGNPSGGTSEGPYFRGGFGIFPLQALAANTVYRVVLTGGSITDLGTHTNYPIPAGYHWCFSTGAAYTPSSDCAPSTTAAEEPANPDASTTPTGNTGGGGGNTGGGGGGNTGGGGGGNTGGGGGGGNTVGGGGTSHPTTLTGTVEDHSSSASLLLPTTCVVKSKMLSVAATAARIAGSHAHAVHFSHAEVFIDRGIKHLHHHTARRLGRKVTVTTFSYSANRSVGVMPSTITLKVATVSSGTHTLRIVFTFHRTVRKNGRSHMVSSTSTLSTKFKVC